MPPQANTKKQSTQRQTQTGTSSSTGPQPRQDTAKEQIEKLLQTQREIIKRTKDWIQEMKSESPHKKGLIANGEEELENLKVGLDMLLDKQKKGKSFLSH